MKIRYEGEIKVGTDGSGEVIIETDFVIVPLPLARARKLIADCTEALAVAEKEPQPRREK